MSEEDSDSSIAEYMQFRCCFQMQDSEACDKVRIHVMTEDGTGTENASMTMATEGANEEARNLDLARKAKNRKEVRPLCDLSDKTDDKLEDSLMDFMANTSNDLHSDKSDVFTENTRVKELSNDYEVAVVNEDYVQQLNNYENQLNETSLDSQEQHVSTDLSSLIDLRAHHPNIPGISLIYKLRDDIRNIRLEDSHSHLHTRSDNEYVPDHGVNVYDSESQRVIPDQPVQLREINDNCSQYRNGYKFEHFNSPSPHYGIHFPPGANRLLVGDYELSMEDPSESNIIEAQRNGRSEEVNELANELGDVKVYDYNIHHREMEFPVNNNEPLLLDHHIFGRPDENSFPDPNTLESISSTTHEHCVENNPPFSQNEETTKSIPSANVTHPVLAATNSFNVHQENSLSGEVNFSVQVDDGEVLLRSRSYASLNRNQERHSALSRQISLPSTESETNGASFDESLQRDFEYALELQQQLNHEILMEDEAFARHLDSSQCQTLSPPRYGSWRTEFFGPLAEMVNLNPERRPQAEEMINLNSQKRPQHSDRHPGRHRREYAANRDGWRNKGHNPEDMISLHQNNRGQTHHSHTNSQGNPQGFMQHRVEVAGASVDDHRKPFDSEYQSVRDSSGRVRPVLHRFKPDPAERFVRITGQSVQTAITPLTQNYQEERRQLDQQMEIAKQLEQRSYFQQNWRTDLNACDKTKTGVAAKKDTLSDNAMRAFDKGRTNKKLQSLDLSRDDQDPQEMRNIFLSDNGLDVTSLEFMANTTSGLHFAPSSGSNNFTESSSYETQVKESIDDFEQFMINDYAPLLNSHEKQFNETSPNPQGQHVSTDPNHMVNLDPERLVDLRALHPDIPGVSLIYRLQDDIRNIRMEDGHSQLHSGSDNEYFPEHGVNVYDSESQIAVPDYPIHLQEIIYNHPQRENGYTLENYILPSLIHSGINFQQEDNKVLVGDTEKCMEDPFEIIAAPSWNEGSEESVLNGIVNEFRDVTTEAYNTHHRETDFPVYQNEPSHSDCHMLGGPNDSSFPHAYGVDGMSYIMHQHCLGNSPTFSQNEQRREIVPSDCNQENNYSAEMSVPSQEALNRYQRYESLHRDQEGPSVFSRQISCLSTELETNTVSSDEGPQRELQQQPNHEIFIEDEALASSHHQSPPQYRGPQTEEMITPNPQRRKRKPQHSYRHPESHRRESAAKRNWPRNNGQSSEDVTSLLQNNRGHRHHSPSNPQGSVQEVNVDDHRKPFDSEYQSVRKSSGRDTIRGRPIPHRFELDPVERFERIPGQAAQIDYSLITPFIQNDQEDRRQHDDKLEASEGEDQYHYMQQNWRTDVERIERIPGQSAQIDPSILTPLTRNYQEDRRRHDNQIRHLEHARQWEHQDHDVQQNWRTDVERIERIPGQSAQIDPIILTSLTRNYQEDRRRHDNQIRHLEDARQWEHQDHDVQQNWRTGHDRLPNEDYHSSVIHPTYNDPDEVFQIEDGEQSVNICQNSSMLRRPPTPLRPTFLIPAHGNLENNDHSRNQVELTGETLQQGLDQEHIEMLPVHRFHAGNAEENTQCTICLNEYCDDDEIRILSCLHKFHMACIDNWLKVNAVCPLCRQRICHDMSQFEK